MPLGVHKLIDPLRHLAQQGKAGEGKKPAQDDARGPSKLLSLGVHKLIDPLRQRYLAQQGKAGEGKKPAQDDARAKVTRTAGPEGQAAKGAVDLAGVMEPSAQIFGAINSSGEGKGEVLLDAPARPLPPEIDLSVQTLEVSPDDEGEALVNAPAQPPPPKIELAVQTLKISPDGKDEVLVDASAQPVPPAGKPPGADKNLSNLSAKSDEEKSKREKEEANDLVSRLFSREEEELNPLLGLVASLPNVTVKELLDEAQEIKAMLGEWQQN